MHHCIGIVENQMVNINLSTYSCFEIHDLLFLAGGLSVGDINGHIGAVSVAKLSTDKIKFSDEVVFNSENDLKVDKITIINYQNITYLVAAKQNYIQVYAINEYGEVVEGKLRQVGNLYITGDVNNFKIFIMYFFSWEIM